MCQREMISSLAHLISITVMPCAYNENKNYPTSKILNGSTVLLEFQ